MHERLSGQHACRSQGITRRGDCLEEPRLEPRDLAARRRRRDGLDRDSSIIRASKSPGSRSLDTLHGVMPTRVQILGETEITYLETLDESEQARDRALGRLLFALEPLARRRDHARGRGPPEALLAAARGVTPRRSSSRSERSSQHHSVRIHRDASIGMLAPSVTRDSRCPDGCPRHRHPASRAERHRQERVRAIPRSSAAIGSSRTIK